MVLGLRELRWGGRQRHFGAARSRTLAERGRIKCPATIARMVRE